MYQLATFTTTDEQGKDVLIRAFDGSIVAREHPSGSQLTNSIVVSMTVADMQTAINGLWDEYIVGLGDPA